MRIDRIELENQARIERARFIAEVIADAITAATRFAQNLWHGASSARVRPMIK